MTMAYENYRDANSRWVDRIPAHWRIERLKFVARPQASNVDKHSKEDEIPVRLCNYTDVYNNAQIIADMDFMEATATQAEIDKFALTDDEVIITKDSESWQDIAVPAHVPNAIEGVLCGYHLTQIRPDQEQLDGRYLYYQLCSAALNRQFQVKANGVTRFGLPAYHIDNSEIIVPPLNEQKQIAKYLDEKLSRIDRLIKKREALIPLLLEKKASVIAAKIAQVGRAESEVKSTGLDYLPKIPSHWKILRLRFAAEINPSASEIQLPADALVSFVPMEAVGEYGGLTLDREKPLDEISQGYTYFRDQDVVVAKITPCFENGKGALADNLINGVAFGTTELHVLRARNEIYPPFLFYITISYFFRKVGESRMYGAGGQKRIPELFVKDIRIPIPPLREQKEIAAVVESESERISEQIEKIKEDVRALREYRSAIITQAVTGTIKVV